MNQFVDPWSRVQQAQLTEQEDDVCWRFTPSGTYTSTSAYNMQFVGTYADFNWAHIWKAKVENKCNFFCWLVLQNKVWTADRILKLRSQTNQICQLCRTHPESVMHMLAECSYSRSVWHSLQSWVGVDVQPPPTCSYRRLKKWWNSMVGKQVRGQGNKEARLQRVIYVVWKERCRRKFDNRAMQPSALQEVIKGDVQQWQIAWSRAVVDAAV
jgi:hypothetical protein